MPQALLLEGPAGLGKLRFGRRVAALALGVDDARAIAGDEWRHADLSETTPPEGKKQIAVDQVRALCANLVLTSHGGGYKVALIHPADRMNIHAANSLLKTLEEPTDRTLLILIRARLDTLPATIASRCQRLRFAVPAEEIAFDWLRSIDPERDWRRLLDLAGGAPLKAVELAQAGLDSLDETYRMDLAGVLRGEESPVAVASRWQKQNLEDTLAWLNAFVTQLIRGAALDNDNRDKDLQIFSQNIRLDALFSYLDEVQAAIAKSTVPLTPQLVIEGLLVPWSHRLDDRSPGGPV